MPNVCKVRSVSTAGRLSSVVYGQPRAFIDRTQVRYSHLGGLVSCIVKEVRFVRYPPRSQSTVTGKLVSGTVLEQRECCWSQQHLLELGVTS